MHPKITVITATYNLIKAGRAETFRQMVESVHAQTYSNIQHLVVDGASTDGTLDLIKEYAAKGWIDYISEKDAGIYDAMNKGIENAAGDYVCILNSDDYYHNPEGLAQSMKKILEKKADFSYAPMYVIGEKGKKKLEKPKLSKLLMKMPISHSSLIVKKNVSQKLGNYNIKYRIAADYDFVLKLFMNGHKGAYNKNSFVTFRWGGISTQDGNAIREELAQLYYDNYSKLTPLTLEECRDMQRTYIFPIKLLRKFVFADYPPIVQWSAVYLLYYRLKKTFFKRNKKVGNG